MNADLVREFMEVDGLTLAEANALATVSVQPRPVAEWLAMIAELDASIASYCSAYRLSDEARARILDVRNRQSLASIPDSLEWFRRELEIIESAKSATGPGPAFYRNSDCQVAAGSDRPTR